MSRRATDRPPDEPAGVPDAAAPLERARTQAEIDAEIAAWGDVPAWPSTPVEPSDPYGWLFRTGAPSALGGSSPMGDALGGLSPMSEPSDTEVHSPLAAIGFGDDDGPATEPFVPYGVTRTPPRQPTAPAPAVRQPATAPQVAGHPAPPAGHRTGRTRRTLLTAAALAICASLGAAATLVAVNMRSTALPQAGTNPATATQPAVTGPTPGTQWSGSTEAITGVTATAECVTAPGVDAARKPVRYDPSNLTDGNSATAWRCDDDMNPTVTLTVPAGREIAAIGIINGYAKIDPADGTDRYPLYRRVLEVRWTLPDGSTVDQKLVDKNADLQIVTVPVCVSGTITLEVLRTTNPSSNSAVRDAVVISEITFLAPKV